VSKVLGLHYIHKYTHTARIGNCIMNQEVLDKTYAAYTLTSMYILRGNRFGREATSVFDFVVPSQTLTMGDDDGCFIMV
jgi:hypothetical protein